MAGNTEQLNLMQKQVSELRSGFDRLFFALQTGFTRLIQAMQILSGNMIKAAVRPDAFLKAISGQAQGKGKASGSSAVLFEALDKFIDGLQMVQGLDDDPNAKATVDSSAGKQQGASYWGTMRKMGDMAKKPLGAMVNQFAALGPQAMLAAVALAPMQEFLTALLEPLEPLTEYFGAFGSILSQIFIPVMQMIMPFLGQLMPLFQAIATALAPIITLLFQFSTIGILMTILQPMIPALIALADVFAQVMTALSPLLTLFGNIVSWGIGVVFEQIGKAFSGLGISAESVTNAIKKFANFISMVTQMIAGFLEFLAGRQSWKEYQNQGTRVTGGGGNGGWW